MREYRRNKLVVGTMAVMPLALVVFPLTTVLAAEGRAPLHAIGGAVSGGMLELFLVPLLLPTIVAPESDPVTVQWDRPAGVVVTVKGKHHLHDETG